MEELAEKAQEATFQDVLARIKHDQRDFFTWVTEKSRVEGCTHVAQVLHLQAQNERGLSLATTWMEQNCLVVQAAPGKPFGAEAFLRKVLRHSGTSSDDLYHICWIDWTKLGRLRQSDVNDMCDLARGILNQNPNNACVIMLAPLLVSDSVIGGLRGEHRHRLYFDICMLGYWWGLAMVCQRLTQ